VVPTAGKRQVEEAFSCSVDDPKRGLRVMGRSARMGPEAAERMASLCLLCRSKVRPRVPRPMRCRDFGAGDRGLWLGGDLVGKRDDVAPKGVVHRVVEVGAGVDSSALGTFDEGVE
jgi:hypothetical protein